MTKKKDPSQLKKRGRKKVPIDYEKAEKLAQILCTQSEIASVLGVSLPVLDHDPEFQRIHKKGLETGRASLRRMQYASASAGNPTMLIWLGKQHLGQRDRQDVAMTGKNGGPMEVNTTLDPETAATLKRLLFAGKI